MNLSARLSLRLSPDLAAWLRAVARAQGIPIAELLRRILVAQRFVSGITAMRREQRAKNARSSRLAARNSPQE